MLDSKMVVEIFKLAGSIAAVDAMIDSKVIIIALENVIIDDVSLCAISVAFQTTQASSSTGVLAACHMLIEELDNVELFFADC